MDFILLHSREILYLVLAVGFLILIVFLIPSLIRLHRVLRKLDDLSDLVIEFIHKPLKMFLEVKDVFLLLRKFFMKR